MEIGLEYINAVFETIKTDVFMEYTLVGMKSLAVLLFLVNILKKYQEGMTEQNGVTWGLRPVDLVRNITVILLVFSAPQILGFLDQVLVSIESRFVDTAPALIPLHLNELEIEDDPGVLDVMTKAMSALYEALLTPLYSVKMLSFILSIFLWMLDLFIYPLFLAERFFILGIMQVFFPLIISLSTFERFRSMAYSFFRLYVAVYMLVPAFFLVNIFVNALYGQINTNFWSHLVGSPSDNQVILNLIEAGSIGFIVLLKFKLYKRATSFTLRLFTS
ncbi:MAG: hypothetical protein CME35_12825 [Gramella sp.]|nr:hypothetical protein [Christiangramia sp.]|tara:strand:+ start:112 stop:936 length:825 start_codon:yes stop_codon:yes gene_type:complete